MVSLSDGEPAAESEIDFVLLLAEHSISDVSIVVSDVLLPLAMWRGLREETAFIEEHFDLYDKDNSGRLERSDLQLLLKDLNGGHEPSHEELEWILHRGTEIKGRLGVDRLELRIGVTIWMHHVSPLVIHGRSGIKMLIPFVYTFIAALASCLVVAATTTYFSEKKTIEFLQSVLLSELWRNVVIDPLKALMIGRFFEFAFGMLL